MHDPIVSLAFALDSSPGAYALLLGSGVSRAAAVPTGWEVVLDLIERSARLENEETHGDPIRWYRARFDQEPSYSALLESLAATPAERQALLRAYFEPTPEEAEQGLKQPTAAQRAIARLVAAGSVRVIVTTNFDRLLERALDEAGVVPAIVASADAAEGALPLAHSPCTVIKLHGDYLDTRILNTPTELGAYNTRVDRLLDQVFDEYGLVVCGWSADWDTALVAAIERCPTRRFSTFWTLRSNPSERTTNLIGLRGAVTLTIETADGFFTELEAKVAALRDVAATHPATPALAVAAAKRYLAEDRFRIRLHDLLHAEVAHIEQASPSPPLDGDRDEFLAAVANHEATCATLAHLMATTAYWATPEQWPQLTGVLDRLERRWRESVGGTVAFINLRDYPMTIAVYAAGLGILAAADLARLAQLFGHREVRRQGRQQPLVETAMVASTLDGQLLQEPGQSRRYTPSSDRLAEVLREPLRGLIPQDDVYKYSWDRLEYLMSLAAADRHETAGDIGGFWAPMGSYVWRNARRLDEETVYAAVEREAQAAGEAWPFLAGPLFNASLERFFEVKAGFDQHISRAGIW